MTQQLRDTVARAQVLLDEQAAAEFLSISGRTLQRWRNFGSGPAFVRIGVRRIGYRLSDLEAWTANHTFASRAAELAQQHAA